MNYSEKKTAFIILFQFGVFSFISCKTVSHVQPVQKPAAGSELHLTVKSISLLLTSLNCLPAEDFTADLKICCLFVKLQQLELSFMSLCALELILMLFHEALLLTYCMCLNGFSALMESVTVFSLFYLRTTSSANKDMLNSTLCFVIPSCTNSVIKESECPASTSSTTSLLLSTSGSEPSLCWLQQLCSH